MVQLRLSLRASWVVGMALLLSTACQTDSPGLTDTESPVAPPPPPPPAPIHASLGILAITPLEGSVLDALGSTEFTATLDYDFGTSSGGEITVVIVCTRHGDITCIDAGILATVAAGSGTRTVKVPLRTIPASSTIELVFMLHPIGATSPVASKAVKYQSSP